MLKINAHTDVTHARSSLRYKNDNISLYICIAMAERVRINAEMQH